MKVITHIIIEGEEHKVKSLSKKLFLLYVESEEGNSLTYKESRKKLKNGE